MNNITVYYDGTCGLCLRELKRYSKLDHDKKITWQDFKAPGFNPAQFGLTMDKLERAMHAKDEHGTVVSGIDAFIWIWRACGFNLLAKVVSLPMIKQLAVIVYRVIAKYRYSIFSKVDQCTDDRCATKLM